MTAMIEAFRKAQEQEQATQDNARVEGARDAIGRPVYDLAVAKLKTWSADAAPFAEFLSGVSAGPMPNAYVAGHVEGMRRVLSSVPRTLAAGVDEWQRLTASMIRDDHSREIWIRTVRQMLRNWDGALESLAAHRGAIERWYRDMADAGPATATEGVVNDRGLNITDFVATTREAT